MSSNPEGAASPRIDEDQGIVLESPYLAVRNPSGSSLRPRFEDGGAVVAESFGRRLDLRSPDGSVSVAHQEETSVISRSDPTTGQVDYQLDTRSSLSASSRSDPSRGSGSERAESTEVHEATRLVVATTNIPVYNHGSGVVNTNNWHSGNTTTTIVKNVVTNNHYYGPPPPPPPPPPQSSPPVASQQTQNESNACPTTQNEVRGSDSERTQDSEKPALDPTQPDPLVSSSGSIKGFFKDFLSSRSSRSTREGRDTHLYLQEFDNKRAPKFIDKWVEHYVRGSDIASSLSSLTIPLFVPYHPPSDKYPSGQSLTFPTIGDVGFLDEQGGSTTLFNVRYSKKVNQELCFNPPESFEPVPDGVLEGKTIEHYRTYYLDKSFELVNGSDQDSESSTYFGLTKSSQTGAILFTPDGSLQRFFKDPTRQNAIVQEYWSAQVIEWYRHLRNNLGYSTMGNGKLLLISGAYLVKTWGVASFHAHQKMNVPFIIELKEVKDGYPRYQWVTAKNMHYASGPNNEHPHHADLDHLDRDYNGCIGVEVLSITCDKET
ncbi:unnamed protein product [Cyclocybe aegerita]|uniref:Uncharacterized protein n=1 Tax=Cyclocybe aegerita TaxID=1973307 RepID=A0A8S0Y0Q1_CYCAE|nr:unnamed protein product [Cyclocybe aegerita]